MSGPTSPSILVVPDQSRHGACSARPPTAWMATARQRPRIAPRRLRPSGRPWPLARATGGS
eukprot:10995423-Alexandrium_andersonii.AAC.1